MSSSNRVSISKSGEFLGHTGSIFALEFSPDFKSLFSGGDDGVLVAWNPENPNEAGAALLRLDTSIYSLAADPSEPRLYVGASNGTLYVLDFERRTLLHTYRPGSDPVYGIFPDNETGFLWVLHGGGMVSAFERDPWKRLQYGKMAAGNIRSVAANTSDDLFLGAADGCIYQLGRRDGRQRGKWQAHDSTVFSLLFSPDENVLFSGGRDARLKAWKSEEEKKLIYDLPAHLYTINDMAMMPEYGWLLTASRDKSLKVWAPEAGKLLKVVDWERNLGHRHSVNRILARQSDNCLFSCSDDRRIIRWQIQPET